MHRYDGGNRMSENKVPREYFKLGEEDIECCEMSFMPDILLINSRMMETISAYTFLFEIIRQFRYRLKENIKMDLQFLNLCL